MSQTLTIVTITETENVYPIPSQKMIREVLSGQLERVDDIAHDMEELYYLLCDMAHGSTTYSDTVKAISRFIEDDEASALGLVLLLRTFTIQALLRRVLGDNDACSGFVGQLAQSHFLVAVNVNDIPYNRTEYTKIQLRYDDPLCLIVPREYTVVQPSEPQSAGVLKGL